MLLLRQAALADASKTEDAIEHVRLNSFLSQILVEDMHNTVYLTSGERDGLLAYLWLSLQCTFRIRFNESLHSSLLRGIAEKLASHLFVHQYILQPLGVTIDGAAESC